MQPATSSSASSTRWISATTLGGIMAAHVLLETGVDATFLANVSVERLPLVTITVAFFALGISQLEGGRSHRSILALLQIVAAAGTLGFWFLASQQLEWSYYALFIWSGIISSLIVVRFWLLLGDLFTIREAKKVFAPIALGGSIGALLGSGIATLLAPIGAGPGLLLAAAFLYLLSAIGPAYFIRAPAVSSEPPGPEPAPERMGLATSFQTLFANRYATRIAGLVVIAGMTLTLGDYVFKSTLTEEVQASQLAIWLSRIYLGLNVLSIAILALGVTPIVRRLGIDRSLVVMPSLIGLAALGVLAGGGVLMTVFLKLADGTLRYSLHKTASELLYIPMTSTLRATVKSAIDIVGQTGAKAAASALLLLLIMAPNPRLAVAGAVLVFASTWIFMALRLRGVYLDVFRQTLNAGLIDTMVDHPELDLESAGSLIRALSDPDEERAIAAMRLLAEREQDRLIPSLILYHPSERVVAHALDLFSATGRDDVSHLLERLVGHEYAIVRAASVRATWALDQEFEGLHALAESNCLVVRVSAMAGLLAGGEIGPDSFRPVLDEVLVDEWCDSRMAAATAARLAYRPVYREALLEMAAGSDPGVAREALAAIRESADDWFLKRLVGLLAIRRAREGARRALIDHGEVAIDVLAERLVDPDTPIAVRIHIPRAISGFESPRAVSVLLKSLPEIQSGMVRFKVLRGLEMLLLGIGASYGATPHKASNAESAIIRREFDRMLERARELYGLESDLSRWQLEDASKATLGGDLLLDLLRDKRSLAAGRLFMMLGLMHPRDDFRAIRNALSGQDVKERDSASELIETLLAPDVARPLLELTRGVRSLRARAGAAPSSDEDYAAQLHLLMRHESEALCAVALYHAGELGIEPVSGEAPRGREVSTDSAAGKAKDRGLAVIRDMFDRRPRGKALLVEP